MKIIVKKQIGKSFLQFEVDEGKGRDALFNAGFFSSIPDTCGLCKSKEVQLKGNKAKGYTFVSVVCNRCGAKSDIGEYKDGGFFWKKFEKTEYVRTENDEVLENFEDEEELPVIEE